MKQILAAGVAALGQGKALFSDRKGLVERFHHPPLVAADTIVRCSIIASFA